MAIMAYMLWSNFKNLQAHKKLKKPRLSRIMEIGETRTSSSEH